MASVCKPTQTPLIVDEAHSFGVLGPEGAGAVKAHQLSQIDVPLRVIPLGKTFAAQGALVAGQADWIQGLLQAGRSIIYSTAMSPALSYGLLKTLSTVIQADERRVKLSQLIDLFRSYIKCSSLDWTDSKTAIQQLLLGCPHLAMKFMHTLKSQGISCSAIRPPTVNLQSTGLRVILNYNHTPEQIKQLFDKLEGVYEREST